MDSANECGFLKPITKAKIAGRAKYNMGIISEINGDIEIKLNGLRNLIQIIMTKMHCVT